LATLGEEFGEDDQSEESDFSTSERKLITQSYDLSVSTLLEQWNDQTLKLPEIQRQYVWDNARASRLIESLLLNIPIPVVYFSETEDIDYLVIDGHQRILSIVRYLSNEFSLSGLKVLSSMNRKRFHQLAERDQRQIRTRVIRAIIIASDSDPSMKFEVFERLNTGSIALNAQEVRNSTHRGPMNELIKGATLQSAFRSCVGTPKPRPRMADNELILRHLALRAGWSTYKPPMSRYLNDYMVRGNKLGDVELEEVDGRLKRTTEGVFAVFGRGAFRITDESGEPVDRAINRALAEVQLTAFSWVDDLAGLLRKRAEILHSTSALYKDAQFLDAIQRATGDRRRTRRRLAMYCEALVRVGISLEEVVPPEND
jgi:hypothetical protein